MRTALRIALGLIFVYAAYTKLRQEWLVFALSIDAYQLLPSWAVLTIARALPWLELLTGIALLTGVRLRISATITTILLAGFYAAMLWAYARGAGIDCGCFDVGEQVSLKTLARDGALLGASVWLTVLAFRGRHSAAGASSMSAAPAIL